MRRIHALDSRQAGALIVLVSLGVGVLVGIVWVLLAPSANDVHVDPGLAASVDAAFGVVAAIAGAIIGFVSALLLRRHGIALSVGVVLGGIAGSGVALGVGLLLGEPLVRALPMLLLWPIAGMVGVVAVGVAVGLGPDPQHPSQAPDADTTPVDAAGVPTDIDD